jgi:hypothetical protein
LPPASSFSTGLSKASSNIAGVATVVAVASVDAVLASAALLKFALLVSALVVVEAIGELGTLVAERGFETQAPIIKLPTIRINKKIALPNLVSSLIVIS